MLPFEEPDIPEDDEEIDPFKELDIGNSNTKQNTVDPLAAFEEDPLSAFDEPDYSPDEDVVISFDDEEIPEIKNDSSPTGDKAESTYKLLLETVWVDDILDPSEVELLARKRKELGLSFMRHLQLVREIIEG